MAKVYFCDKHYFRGIDNEWIIDKESSHKMKILEIRISISSKRRYRNSKIEFWIKSKRSRRYDFLLNRKRIHDRKKYIRYMPDAIIPSRKHKGYYFRIKCNEFKYRISAITISGYKIVG